MKWHPKGALTVLAVLLIASSGSVCILAMPPSAGDAHVDPVLLSTSDSYEPGALEQFGIADWKVEGKKTSFTMNGTDISTGEGSDSPYALCFYPGESPPYQKSDDVIVEITLVGDNSVVSGHPNGIGILAETKDGCRSIGVVFKGAGTLSTNGIRLCGDIALQGGCRINSECTSAYGDDAAIAVAVGGPSGGTVTVGTGCALDAIVSGVYDASEIDGIVAKDVLIYGGHVLISLESILPLTAAGLCSNTTLSITMRNNASLISDPNGKGLVGITAIGGITVDAVDSTLYSCGSIAGMKPNGDLVFNGYNSDVYCSGLMASIDIGDNNVSGSMPFRYGHYMVLGGELSSFPDFRILSSRLKDDPSKKVEFGSNVVFIERPMSSEDYGGYDYAIVKHDSGRRWYLLPERPTVIVEGKAFDRWVVSEIFYDERVIVIDRLIGLPPSVGFCELQSVWKDAPESHTVTYDVDGKTTVVSVVGDSFTVTSEIPAKEGYDFTGWLISGTSTVVQPCQTITVTSDMTLVAQWEEHIDPVPPKATDGTVFAVIVVLILALVLAIALAGCRII